MTLNWLVSSAAGGWREHFMESVLVQFILSLWRSTFLTHPYGVDPPLHVSPSLCVSAIGARRAEDPLLLSRQLAVVSEIQTAGGCVALQCYRRT